MAEENPQLEVFNKMRPKVKNFIMKSLTGLCEQAIAKKRMDIEQKAGILDGTNDFVKAPRFLDHFNLLIEEDPSAMDDFIDLLRGLATCKKLVEEIGKRVLPNKEGHFT